MMGVFDLLEDFSEIAPPLPPQDTEDEDVEIEDFKLEAFERGYSAGWEDALEAQSGRQGKLSDTLELRLQDLSFTYHEALNQMSENLKPVLNCLFEEILPISMAATLAPRMADEVARLAQSSVATPVVLLVPTGTRDAVLGLLSRDHQMPIDVRENQDLTEDEVRLKIDGTTYDIDSGSTIKAIRNAIEDYLYHTRKEVSDAKSD